MQVTAPKRVIKSWTLYDWANSVYNLVITSTIFPTYYEIVTGDGKDDTANDKVIFWGREISNISLQQYVLAGAFLIVAFLIPILSSIADYKGNKKKFLFSFCSMGALSCAALFFFVGKTNLGYGLFFMALACIGYWSSLVFYNSYLPEIAAPKDRDNISARGFIMGYIGSVLLQVVCLLLVLKKEWFGISDVKVAMRISFLLVGCWWFSFAMLALKGLPKGQPSGHNFVGNILSKGYNELSIVLKEIKKQPILPIFLLACFFYNMGVQTIMLSAATFGRGELNIPADNLIIAILLIQLIAIPGAYLISKLSAWVGNFKALICTVIIWVIICIIGYNIPREGINEFYILASIVGFVMGGIQSLSRSTYAKLMPETKDTASYFSFYDVTEKIAIVIGMFSFGFLIDTTGSQRSSVLALMAFFVVGLLILIYAQFKAKKIKQVW
jgi:MFS transporter, UMF1 family